MDTKIGRLYNTAGEEIKNIMGNWNLDIENNLVSKTRIEPFLAHEIGPMGSACQNINLENLKNTGGVILSADKELVQYSESWKQTSVTGMWGLFKANYWHAAPDKAAYCEYQLLIKESGTYKICLIYFPNKENASEISIFMHKTVVPANTKEPVNCRK